MDTDDQHDRSASSWGDVSLPIPDDVQRMPDSREDGRGTDDTPLSTQPEVCM